MRYRDHINTGALIFSGLYFLYLQVSGFGNAILKMLFPFLDMVRAHSAQPLFLTTAAIAFFFGASFPDIDVAFYAKGHRSRSPLHNLSTAGALYALSVLLCLWLKEFSRESSVIYVPGKFCKSDFFASPGNITASALDHIAA